MAYKTLLAFHALDENVSDLDQAISLAESSGAHLDIVVLGVLMSPPVVMHDTAPAAEWVKHNREVVETAAARAREVEQYVASKSVSASVVAECDYLGRIDSIAARYALCVDFHVSSRSSLQSYTANDKAFNGTLFDAGCPFILMPEGELRLADNTRIAIAWNGRAEAACAVKHALPLLKRAERVHVIAVDPDQKDMGDDPGSDLAAYLSRYDIKVNVDILASGGMTVSEKLLQRVMDIDAGLLVMGACGHTKLREWLLGGTTRDILETADVPVLMAH